MEILEMKNLSLMENDGKGNSLKRNLHNEIPARFFVWAEKFLKGDVIFLDKGYKAWYEDMSSSMENQKQYVNEKFLLIRKDVTKIYMLLSFWAKPNGSITETEHDSILTVEGLYERLPADTDVFLLHKNDGRKCIKMHFVEEWEGGRDWHNFDRPGDGVYHGKSCSIIYLAVLK